MLDAARAVGAIVVVNGSDSSDHVGEYLRQGFEYILLGEAEWTLLELVRAILSDSELKPEHIPGVTFLRDANDEVFRTPSRPLLRDLDTLPLPARDLMDLEAYRNAWKSRHELFSLNLVASRGCPYRCNWCARPIYGASFHIRSAEAVAEEMSELKYTYGAEHLWFADDLFGLRPAWVMELADAVERRAASVPFKIQSRVNLITSEIAAALQRAGCTEVWMGVESGSQKVLDAMDKGTRVDQVYMARDHLRRQGIRACFFLQFGYPGETWEDIQQTVQLVRQTRPDDIGVSVSYPLPGTKFYERIREELGEKTNWVDSDDLSVIFKGTYSDEFYRALRDALHAEVNAWNSRLGSAGFDEACHDFGLSTPVKELWRKVEQMEKTSRNPEPTLCSVAI